VEQWDRLVCEENVPHVRFIAMAFSSLEAGFGFGLPFGAIATFSGVEAK
jgi:hypothetical protein